MELREHCGFCVTHTLHDAYNFIKDLRHRGKEGVGIGAVSNERIDAIKWIGPMERFDVNALHIIFPVRKYGYHTFFAHCRYATRGQEDRLLEDTHPFVIGGTVTRKKSHIHIRDCEAAIVHNGQVDIASLGLANAPSALDNRCDTESLLHYYREKSELEILRNIPGAYTLAIADKRKKEVIVLRDRTGLRPGFLGYKDGKYCVASEDITIRKNGGIAIENLAPGTAYYLSPKGDYRKEQVVQPNLRHCFFEWNYFSDVESTLDHVPVASVRYFLGEEHAREFRPGDAHVTAFLPRCPEPAARRYADITGIPFVEALVKQKNERAFMGTREEERKTSIEETLEIHPDIGTSLQGKNVVLIDDSLVRGNNSIYARDLLRGIGVNKIYLLSYTPPIGIMGNDGAPRGCMFGVDMPPTDKFIARNRTQEQISEMLGMHIHYLSISGMLRAFQKAGMPSENLCTYCIGGGHPFDFEASRIENH